MKGERMLKGTPFRFGGLLLHNYDMTSEEWAETVTAMRRCWACGGSMRGVKTLSGTKIHSGYPYIATFKITKGKYKGRCCFKTLCRACAYDYGVGVIEMDGETYLNYYDFNEAKYKKKIGYKFGGDE